MVTFNRVISEDIYSSDPEENKQGDLLLQVCQYNTEYGKVSHQIKAQFSVSMKQFIEEKDICLQHKNGFEINIKNINKQPSESFLKYLFNGCEIDMHIGINFTKSNGLY